MKLRAILAVTALAFSACGEDERRPLPPTRPPMLSAAEAAPIPKLDEAIARAPEQQPGGVPLREALRYRADLIRNARFVWGLDAPVATFAAQVHQESTWRADIRSHAGAEGLAQFMPRTADWISGAYPAELADRQPSNPAWALRALVRYDRHLWERVAPFDSECDRMKFALSDYNGGAGWRMRRQRASPAPGNFEVTGRINPGITPSNQRENEQYPQRIIHRWQPMYASWGPGVLCGSEDGQA